MLARARLEQLRVLLCDLLDDLDKASITANRIAVELLHVRADSHSAHRSRERHSQNLLLNLGEEPPLGKMTEDGDGEDQLASTDECKAEERGTTDELRVVQVAAKDIIRTAYTRR